MPAEPKRDEAQQTTCAGCGALFLCPAHPGTLRRTKNGGLLCDHCAIGREVVPADPTPPPDPLREALEAARRQARSLQEDTKGGGAKYSGMSISARAALIADVLDAALARPAESGRGKPFTEYLAEKMKDPAFASEYEQAGRDLPPPPTAYDDARIEREAEELGQDVNEPLTQRNAARIAAFARRVRDETAAALRPKATGFDVEEEARKLVGQPCICANYGQFASVAPECQFCPAKAALQRALEAGREEGR